MVLEEEYCATGEILELAIPRWDSAKGQYLGQEDDAVVCCVLAFTAPGDAAVFAPMSGEANNTGGSFWRDSISGDVVDSGTSLLTVQVHANDDIANLSDVTLVFTPNEYPTAACPNETWDLRTACLGRGAVEVSGFVGRVDGDTVPGFGGHTLIVKHLDASGDLLDPESLREFYGLPD